MELIAESVVYAFFAVYILVSFNYITAFFYNCMDNDLITKYFGVNEEISIIEITVRASIMFLITFITV